MGVGIKMPLHRGAVTLPYIGVRVIACYFTFAKTEHIFVYASAEI